jgi:hypothetical protein
MDSTSHLHNTILQTIRVFASIIKFVHQIFGTVFGELFVFVEIDFLSRLILFFYRLFTFCNFISFLFVYVLF